jgi:hypothetical protein
MFIILRCLHISVARQTDGHSSLVVFIEASPFLQSRDLLRLRCCRTELNCSAEIRPFNGDIFCLTIRAKVVLRGRTNCESSALEGVGGWFPHVVASICSCRKCSAL